MPAVTARIQNVTVKTVNTARGSGDVYTVEADRKYTTWKRDIAQAAKELIGQDAEIAYSEQQKGDFTNYYIDSVLPLRGTAPDFERAPGPVPQDVKEQRIMRQTAAKVAVEQLRYFTPDDQTKEMLVALTEMWHDYFENGWPEVDAVPGGFPTDDIPF
jgi:hypothetical protein